METPSLTIRWSEQEARKPYARPFGVTFYTGDTALGSLALSGSDLLYYRQFQTAVLGLGGELFSVPAVSGAASPQRAWLDLIAGLVPPAPKLTLVPHSRFEDPTGRSFIFRTNWQDREWTQFTAPAVLDYQEFQASLIHQTGRLFRESAIEAIDDDVARQRAWVERLAAIVPRPELTDAMSEAWPWRPGA